jgi:hypothetical protein
LRQQGGRDYGGISNERDVTTPSARAPRMHDFPNDLGAEPAGDALSAKPGSGSQDGGGFSAASRDGLLYRAGLSRFHRSVMVEQWIL